MTCYVLLTESAIDQCIFSDCFDQTSFLPRESCNVHRRKLSDDVDGYRVAGDDEGSYCALINTECLIDLADTGIRAAEAYRRISRVVKSFKSPPVHLPRLWCEYHYKNLLAFFASSKTASNLRWVAELDGDNNCVRFDILSSSSADVALDSVSVSPWPKMFPTISKRFLGEKIIEDMREAVKNLSEKVDLEAIGSGAVAQDRSFEDWELKITDPQKDVLNADIESSVRIVGPAGSGKTLSLCMRAIKIARDKNVINQGKKILVATHSWAMAERIDGILSALNLGVPPERVTVFPLMSLLEVHAGHIGQQRTEVIGDDSTQGRSESINIIREFLETYTVPSNSKLSKWILDGLSSGTDSRSRLDLVLNLYEEISGVLTASGVAADDTEAIRVYISGKSREEWMPPFISVEDRNFVVDVYRSFMQELIDRSCITTDQFVLDSIRILETFTWRMRKETEGYDYIFVDELQMFDPQERSALELLGRLRKGVPFITAEDPSQGVFAALNGRSRGDQNVPIYLETVHRFNKEIFDLIRFIYQKFPLNTFPLKVKDTKLNGNSRPILYSYDSDNQVTLKAIELARKLYRESGGKERICLATLGDVDVLLQQSLEAEQFQVTRLDSFDDVEQLSYVKRSVIVAPWQFIGGTQFSHVVVVGAGIDTPSSQFGKLRELISVYLSCSRAEKSLSIVCSGYVPSVLREAQQHGLLNNV